MAGVYISYPFCGQKCTYCNFASGVSPARLERDYERALIAEIRRHAWTWTPETVYLGGGTPSRLEPDTLGRILSGIPGRPWREATMEAAPGTITVECARLWRQLGITRVSLGVQSFHEREIRQTGRKHTAGIVASEVEWLREAGIGEINIDLIAGLPHQTAESWELSLDWIRKLGPPHVSVYLLEVDDDSRLGSEILRSGARFGAASVPSEDESAAFYERAVDALAEMGIQRYEISNFALPGHESQHNLKYWRLEPYLGFGADAHSFDGRTRRRNAETAADYVARPASACVEETPAHDADRFLAGLRLTRGMRIEPAEWRRRQAALEPHIEAGLLERDGDIVRLTSRGVLLSNEVFQEFVS